MHSYIVTAMMHKFSVSGVEASLLNKKNASIVIYEYRLEQDAREA